MKTRLRILAATLLVLHQASATAAIVVYSTDSSFLSTAPALSTENFNSFTNNYGFTSPVIALGGVEYSTTECTNRCWTFDGSFVSGNSLLSNALGVDTLSFGTNRYVDALGFWFTSGATGPGLLSPLWEIFVEETDGTSTYVPIDTPSLGPVIKYYGFVSTVGISKVTVRDYPLDNGSSQFAFDNVSRSAILGGSQLEDSVPVPPPGLGGPDGPICVPGPCPVGIPEPSTLSIGLLGLAAMLRARRRSL